jgi:hypothetical protein
MRIIVQPPDNSAEGFVYLSHEIRKPIEILRANSSGLGLQLF